MPQSYAALYYHIVFRTKDKFTLLPEPIFTRLGEYLGGILRNLDGTLLAYGGMPDHIHLLVSLGREMSLAATMKSIKGYSSKWIHETFPEYQKFAWQSGYGAFTVSPSVLPKVKQYIATQAEHHRHRTYREELLLFLKEYGIEYDEKWISDEG
ncbi:MAG TPA: IS200/IS605 family transposase [Candidatus Kapabacteria bacterium]|nr:IS200/IS605 family transposase [Candidatus Kapabacteria bacterium]